MGPFVDWKQLSKDSLSVRISHYKAPELKSKEKTDWQRQDGGPRGGGTTTKDVRGTAGEERDGAVFETIMTENFPKLTSDTKPQICEAQRTPRRTGTPEPHLGISFSNYEKSKVKIPKEARRKKHLTYRRTKNYIRTTFPQKLCK